MSPRRSGRDPWARWDRWEPKPRIAVTGGVEVARPGKVSNVDAVAIIAFALSHSSSAIPGRARTYARHGQVVNVSIDDESAQAEIQGSDPRPYQVALCRTASKSFAADCTCPYGCTPGSWCKHAVALAYVVAELVDSDPASAARWTGSADPAAAAAAAAAVPVAVDPELLARLAAPRSDLVQHDVLTRAAEVVPLPPT